MMYSDIRDFVAAGLAAKGYGSANPDIDETVRTMPMLDPGPVTIERLQKRTPQAMVFLTLGNGIGLVKEGLFDKKFLTVRALGMQHDFEYAEQLAKDLDDLLLEVENHTFDSGARVLFITRNAPPQLVDFDSADRYHFQTTYILEDQR